MPSVVAGVIGWQGDGQRFSADSTAIADHLTPRIPRTASLAEGREADVPVTPRV